MVDGKLKNLTFLLLRNCSHPCPNTDTFAPLSSKALITTPTTSTLTKGRLSPASVIIDSEINFLYWLRCKAPHPQWPMLIG